MKKQQLFKVPLKENFKGCSAVKEFPSYRQRLKPNLGRKAAVHSETIKPRNLNEVSESFHAEAAEMFSARRLWLR